MQDTWPAVRFGRMETSTWGPFLRWCAYVRTYMHRPGRRCKAPGFARRPPGQARRWVPSPPAAGTGGVEAERCWWSFFEGTRRQEHSFQMCLRPPSGGLEKGPVLAPEGRAEKEARGPRFARGLWPVRPRPRPHEGQGKQPDPPKGSPAAGRYHSSRIPFRRWFHGSPQVLCCPALSCPV